MIQQCTYADKYCCLDTIGLMTMPYVVTYLWFHGSSLFEQTKILTRTAEAAGPKVSLAPTEFDGV